MRLDPRSRVALALALAAWALAAPSRVRAQSTAYSTNYPPSVRAAGMAGCSNAVFWGGDVDSWSNPALLGYQSGLRYENARSQLIPDFASDVFFTSKRVFAGGGGLGFVFAGKPWRGAGSVRLDYGPSPFTSPTGEYLGTFDAHEDVDTWGVGLSVGRAAEALSRALTGHAPGILRYADVALGMNHKDVTLALSPDNVGFPTSGTGKGKADDRGIFFRLSPYNSFAGPGRLAGLDRALRVAVDAAYGTSKLNRGQPPVYFPALDQQDAMLEERHRGWSARIAVHPRVLERELDDRHLRWLEQSLLPAVSFGAAWDRNTLDYQGFDPSTDTFFPARSHIVNRGWELTFLNLVSVRHGHVSDPNGSIHGTSSGWSVGYTFARCVGFRYDRATVPEAIDAFTGMRLADVHRRAWSTFVDPLRVIAFRRGEALDKP